MRKLLVFALIGLAACGASVASDGDADQLEPVGPNAAGAWQKFTTDHRTLTIFSSEPLLVNAPFFGIEVRINGVDVSDDIVDVAQQSPTSWRYTFATEDLDTPGDRIVVSLQNRPLASPGHYVTVRDGTQLGNTVQGMHELLAQCENGDGPCAGAAPLPGLLAAVKGLSRRYTPRDLETAPGVYDFSPVFADAAYLASVGMRLHVMFSFKSFAIQSLFDGDGATKTFAIPAAWDKDREREIRVYIGDIDTPYTFDATRTHVVLSSAPPVGTENVAVTYARDPFPEYTWHLSPPVGGWYTGQGGPNTGHHGSHGFAHAPWRATCVEWMRKLMAAFEQQWTDAIAADPSLASAIESLSILETANAVGGPDYNEADYRAGLLEYTKSTARAVRRRAMFGQLFNQIPGGGANNAIGLLANAIIPWGARLEGPDLFNDEASLEDKVYQRVHRDLHYRALTMIWHQNASYQEPDGHGGYYTPAQQFEKAKRGIADTRTASGTPGLEAEYVFWNMTQSKGPGFDWKDALPVIAANPVIQTWGNERYLWRSAVDRTPIPDQSLSKVNP
jgi:hypothetical protein